MGALGDVVITPSTTMTRMFKTDSGTNNFDMAGSSAVLLPSGEVLVCWSEWYDSFNPTRLILGKSPSVTDFFTVTDSVVPTTRLVSKAAGGEFFISASVSYGPDGLLWLFVASCITGATWDPSIPAPGAHEWGLHAYTSSDDGATWNYVVELPWSLTAAPGTQGSSAFGRKSFPGDILEVTAGPDAGLWVLSAPVWTNFVVTNNAMGNALYVSADQGATWTLSDSYANALGAGLQPQTCEFPPGEVHSGWIAPSTPLSSSGFAFDLTPSAFGTATFWQNFPAGTGCALENAGSFNTFNAVLETLARVNGGQVDLWTTAVAQGLGLCAASVPPSAVSDWAIAASYADAVDQVFGYNSTMFQQLGASFAALMWGNGVVGFDVTTGIPSVSGTIECELSACGGGGSPGYLATITLTNLGGPPITFLVDGVESIVSVGPPVDVEVCWQGGDPCDGAVFIEVTADGILVGLTIDGPGICCPPLDIRGLIPCRDEAVLGNGQDLRVLIMSRGGGSVLAEISPTDGNFTRELDATSTLTLSGTVGGRLGDACCDNWSDIYSWATEVLVYRDGRDAWCGPVTGVTFGYGTVSVEASDLTAWWDRRVLPSLSFQGVDLGTMFQETHDAAMAPDTSPNIVLDVAPAGIVGTRTINGSSYVYASDFLNELATTDLDFTAFGRTVIVRGSEINQEPYYTLLDEYWTTPPQVKERGNEQATVVIMRGSGVQSVATASAAYLNFYGYLVRVFTEETIKDQATCDRAAQSRLDLLKDPVYIETPAGAKLKTSAPILLEQLIPGVRMRVDTQSTCRQVVADFRLKKVSVDFNGDVSIDLQPIGTIEDLEPQAAIVA